MSYKTLLVHLDDSRPCSARTAVALDLARRFDAHVIGLYIVCQELLHPLCRTDESLRPAALEAQHEERQQRARSAFLDAAQRAGCSAEWRAPPGPAVETATLHARHADLSVLGQTDPKDPATYIARHFVEDLLMTSGRPALVIPYAGKVETLGDNVIVAWDASLEAARALSDSLPLIRRARFVTVEEIVRHRDARDERDEVYEASDTHAPHAIDVSSFLERHHIRASFSTTPRVAGVSAGATLLNRVSDLHADLLVMGAYGHSRAQERVLGGATRTILESMTVPVLMSH
ncbi:universal stress protein [Paraburkholderia rhizosphaerae]|uniref:Nucleotide-binding universal stress UspA family protein n=1 Tax=Paraburkholderia rhizosphaerae TaxID=480658 RepID=A0A4R8LW00_9BURK|nr:universal stress protein [Paraburkholderia rhizosphaerae]TDY50967.1 nucleotide-binding universal stress UspA family protein [Paraburkholderia rhizosphaerae]